MHIAQRILRHKFVIDVSTLMVGTVSAQALTILLLPIVTRLYSPGNFGIMALFGAIVSIIEVVACGRYEQAIMLPKKDEEAANVLVLAFLILLGATFICILVFIPFHKSISNILNKGSISLWLLFIPFVVFTGGLRLILTYWASRKKAFKLLAIMDVSRALGNSGVKVSSGVLFGDTAGGLIGGIIGQRVVANLVLGISILKRDFRKLIKVQGKTELLKVAKKYWKFPIFSSWSALLNTLSRNIPIFLFASFFNSTVVGFYALANNLLRLPVNFLGTSVYKVYFQKAAELKSKGDSLADSMLKTTLGLFAIGIIPFSVIVIWGQQLFALICGDNWIEAGLYAQVLSPWFLTVFMNQPSNVIFNVMQKQDVYLGFFIIKFISRVIVIFIGYKLFGSIFETLILLTIVSSIINILMIAYSYKIAKKLRYK